MSSISLQVAGIDQIDLSIWKNNDVELLKSIDNWKNRNDLYNAGLHSQLDSYVVKDILSYNQYLDRLVLKASEEEYYDESLFMEALKYRCSFWLSNQQILAIYLPFKKTLTIC